MNKKRRRAWIIFAIERIETQTAIRATYQSHLKSAFRPCQRRDHAGTRSLYTGRYTYGIGGIGCSVSHIRQVSVTLNTTRQEDQASTCIMRQKSFTS
jgi:hypothetical protein